MHSSQNIIRHLYVRGTTAMVYHKIKVIIGGRLRIRPQMWAITNEPKILRNWSIFKYNTYNAGSLNRDIHCTVDIHINQISLFPFPF